MTAVLVPVLLSALLLLLGFFGRRFLQRIDRIEEAATAALREVRALRTELIISRRAWTPAERRDRLS